MLGSGWELCHFFPGRFRGSCAPHPLACAYALEQKGEVPAVPDLDRLQHRKLAVELFNHVWNLLEKEDLTPRDTDAVIHAAHASRHHWSLAGTTINLARGEWQISRVYAVLNRPEPALYHAHRCLAYCQEAEENLSSADAEADVQAAGEASSAFEPKPARMEDWDIPFAYEALSRAYAVAGNQVERDKYLALAEELGSKIADKEDRDLLFADLATIPQCPVEQA